MQVSTEHQELVDFFSSCDLPTGPQHVNEYSVFLSLSAAVNTNLHYLSSEVEMTRKSAALMLKEIKQWLDRQAT